MNLIVFYANAILVCVYISNNNLCNKIQILLPTFYLSKILIDAPNARLY